MKASGAHLAAVISTGNVLWCASRFDDDVDVRADALYGSAIAPQRRHLRRGARIEVVAPLVGEVCVACSFASIYVLAVWITVTENVQMVDGKITLAPFDASYALAAIASALPRVEPLTLSLPPPNPEPAEGSGKGIA